MALNNKVPTTTPNRPTGNRILRRARKATILSLMEPSSQEFDLGLVWNWEFDREFLKLISSAAQDRNLSTLMIDQLNLAESMELLKSGRLHFRFVLDRASDEDERFLPLSQLLGRRLQTSRPSAASRVINPYELQRRASDKATMHLEFLSRGLHVPYTIIISPFNHKRELELSLSELAQLGRPFIIKPANTTGGGIGVVVGAESLKDIIETRQHHKNDKYLLQEKVVPVQLAGRRAWFRVFHAFGLILLCWWDDQTHVYEELTSEQEQAFGLGRLRSIGMTIREICGLDFFSTEVALTAENSFIVVDYVNEMCDMRLQSRHADGVPDGVVRSIAVAMAEFVAGTPPTSPF